MGRLIKCRDCDHDISKNAAACPKCGAIPKKRTGPVTKLLAIIIFVPMASSVILMVINPGSTATQSAGNSTPETSPQEYSSNREMFLADKSRALAWRAADITSIEEILKDADSAEFKAVFTSFYSDSPVTCGQVNAKNSYGAYAGFKDFVAAESAGIRVVRGDGQMENSEFDKVWNAACQDPLPL